MAFEILQCQQFEIVHFSKYYILSLDYESFCLLEVIVQCAHIYVVVIQILR